MLITKRFFVRLVLINLLHSGNHIVEFFRIANARRRMITINNKEVCGSAVVAPIVDFLKEEVLIDVINDKLTQQAAPSATNYNVRF